MRKSKCTEPQTVGILREAEAGAEVLLAHHEAQGTTTPTIVAPSDAVVVVP